MSNPNFLLKRVAPMLTIKNIDIPGYEKVVEAQDPARGLHCFIAIHSCKLGPSLGGTRIHLYPSANDALQDALLLSRAMTYKSAICENGLGGGKSVIIANSHRDKTPELLHAFAEVVDSLKGQYIAAEDVGSTLSDMTIIRQRTPYVAALPSEKSSGDPSRFTAWGVFRGIQAVAYNLWGSKSIRGKTIAIQGLGNVGYKLASFLFWEGARLAVCDVNEKLAHQCIHDFGAQVIHPNDFCKTEADILAPCALGGIINPETISQLRCKGIAGGANNQLSSVEIGQKLMEKRILYAPDFIINAGGIINASAEFDEGGYNPIRVRDKVDHIYEILLNIFKQSAAKETPTQMIANEIAEYNLKNNVGKRTHPIKFT